MLSLTKKTDYALITLGYLSERRTQTTSAREIAEAFKMPPALVMNILKTLNHAGMLDSMRGTRGGYRLIADLAEISMHELIEVIEGPVRLAECVITTNEKTTCRRHSTCKVGKACPIQAPIRALHGKLVGFLRETKLSTVLPTNGHSTKPGAMAVSA
jgi:Rrf2 family transcriptional regulator, nitric oxide-sensitive transcriptional repressor